MVWLHNLAASSLCHFWLFGLLFKVLINFFRHKWANFWEQVVVQVSIIVQTFKRKECDMIFRVFLFEKPILWHNFVLVIYERCAGLRQVDTWKIEFSIVLVLNSLSGVVIRLKLLDMLR